MWLMSRLKGSLPITKSPVTVIVFLVAIFNVFGPAQCGWKRSRDLKSSPKASQVSPHVVFDPSTGTFRKKSDIGPRAPVASRVLKNDHHSEEFIQRRKRIRSGLRKRGRVSLRRVKAPRRSDDGLDNTRIPTSDFLGEAIDPDSSLEHLDEDAHYSDPQDDILPSSSNTYVTQEKYSPYSHPSKYQPIARPNHNGFDTHRDNEVEPKDDSFELTSLAPVTYDYTIGERNYDVLKTSHHEQSTGRPGIANVENIPFPPTPYPHHVRSDSQRHYSSTPFSLYISNPPTSSVSSIVSSNSRTTTSTSTTSTTTTTATTTKTTTTTTTTTASTTTTVSTTISSSSEGSFLLKKRGQIESTSPKAKTFTKYKRKPYKKPKRNFRKKSNWKPSKNREEIREKVLEEFSSSGLGNEVVIEYPKSENAKFPHFPSKDELPATLDNKDEDVDEDEGDDSSEEEGKTLFLLSHPRLLRNPESDTDRPNFDRDESNSLTQEGSDSLFTPSLSKSSFVPFENARLPIVDATKKRKSGRFLQNFAKESSSPSSLFDREFTTTQATTTTITTTTTTTTSTTTTATRTTTTRTTTTPFTTTTKTRHEKDDFEWGKKNGDEDEHNSQIHNSDGHRQNEDEGEDTKEYEAESFFDKSPFEFNFKSRRPSEEQRTSSKPNYNRSKPTTTTTEVYQPKTVTTTTTERSGPFGVDNIYSKGSSPFSVIPPHATPKSILENSKNKPTFGPSFPFYKATPSTAAPSRFLDLDTPDPYGQAIPRTKRKQVLETIEAETLYHSRPQLALPIHKNIDIETPNSTVNKGKYNYHDYFGYGEPAQHSASASGPVQKEKPLPVRPPPPPQPPIRLQRPSAYYKPALSFMPSQSSSSTVSRPASTTERSPFTGPHLERGGSRDSPKGFGHFSPEVGPTVTVRPYGHPSTVPPMHGDQLRLTHIKHREEASKAEHHHELESETQTPPHRHHHHRGHNPHSSSSSSYYHHPTALNRDHADIHRLPPHPHPAPSSSSASSEGGRGGGGFRFQPALSFDRTDAHSNYGDDDDDDIFASGIKTGTPHRGGNPNMFASPTEKSVTLLGQGAYHYPEPVSSSGFGANYNDYDENRDHDHSIYDNADKIVKSYELKKVDTPTPTTERYSKPTTNKDLYENLRNDKIYGHHQNQQKNKPEQGEEPEYDLEETYGFHDFKQEPFRRQVQDQPRQQQSYPVTENPLVIQDYFGNPASVVGRFSGHHHTPERTPKLKRENGNQPGQNQEPLSEFSKVHFQDEFFQPDNDPFMQSSSIRHTSSQRMTSPDTAKPRLGSRGIGFDFSAEFPPFPKFGGLASISRMHDKFSFGNERSTSS